MSLCLSDEASFEGGELLFSITEKNNKKTILTVEKMKKKGSLIVFPSYIWHKVKPVTKGTRYSLVTWYLGNAYR
jgi:PKHD-type hydroxylase